MKTRLRIFLKLILILLFAVCFLILMKKDTREFRMKQPEGEGITVDDAVILMQALNENTVLNETASEGLGKWLDQMKNRYAENVCRGGLGHAPLLICDCNYFHEFHSLISFA